MITLEVAVDDTVAYLIPIGDIHIGDKAFGKVGRKKLQGYLDWVQERENARIFLMGDIFNCASRGSKTSPFETDPGEYEKAVEIFAPYSKKIIGAIDGNHERRVLDYFGFSPTQSFCAQLKIPYCGLSAALKFRVGPRPDTDNQYWQIYWVYAHHTTGGGGTLGSAMNKVVKLQEVVAAMDVYLGGHNHQLVTGTRIIFVPAMNSLVEKKIHYVDCGSYLDWDGSYAEAAAIPPSKLGSPRIRFNGERDRHDVHVSL